jgi:hypothetical protein
MVHKVKVENLHLVQNGTLTLYFCNYSAVILEKATKSGNVS